MEERWSFTELGRVKRRYFTGQGAACQANCVPYAIRVNRLAKRYLYYEARSWLRLKASQFFIQGDGRLSAFLACLAFKKY